MKYHLLCYIFITLASCTESRNTANKEQNDIPDNAPDTFSEFEKVWTNLEHYTKDTLTIEFPGEGGEAIVYHAKADNLLMQVFIYGAMGKVNYLYLLDKKLAPKLTKITRYYYDRPFTETDMQIDSTINYISYLPGVKYLDGNQASLKDTSEAVELRAESESLLKDIISKTDLRK